MTGVLGQLRVPITADTQRFDRGLRGVVQRTRTAARDTQAALAPMTRGFGALTAAMGAAGALAGIASFTGAIRTATEALSEFDRIGKDARASGVSTDFYQTLALAANEASVEQSAMTAGLLFFTRQMGEARLGIGQLAARIGDLSPALLEAVLASRSQEEALRLIADAVRDADSATTAATLAVAAFGRSGVQMVEVLRQGSAGFDDTAERARRLGLVIDEDLIARAEELQTEFGVAQQVMDVNFKQVLVEMVPVLVSTAQALADIARAVNTTSEAIKNMPDPPEWFWRLYELEGQISDLAAPLNPLRAGWRLRGQGLQMLENFNNRVADQREASRAASEAFNARFSGAQSGPSLPGSGPSPSSFNSLFSGLSGLSTGGGSGSVLSGGSGSVRGLARDLDEATGSALDLTQSLYSLQTEAERSRAAFSDFGGEVGGALSPLLQQLTADLGDTERALLQVALAAAKAFLNMPSISSTPLGGFLGGVVGSFDGGGYTGPGSRSGGLDGRGGFLAMLHPDETVLDHTRGQRGSGGVLRLIIEEAPGFASRVRSEAEGVAVQVVRRDGPTMAIGAVTDYREGGGSL